MTNRVAPRYQRTADDCGVACLEHVARLHRVDLPVDEVSVLRRRAGRDGQLTLADLHQALLRSGLSPRALAVRDWRGYLDSASALGRTHVVVAAGHHFVVAIPHADGTRVLDPARGVIDIESDTCAALLGHAVVRVEAPPRRRRPRLRARTRMAVEEIGSVASSATATMRRSIGHREVCGVTGEIDRIVVRRSTRALGGFVVSLGAVRAARSRALVPDPAAIGAVIAIAATYTGVVRDARAVRFQTRVVRSSRTSPGLDAEQLILRDVSAARRRRAGRRAVVLAVASAVVIRTSAPMLGIAVAAGAAVTSADTAATIDTLRRTPVALAYRKDRP